MGRKNDIDQRLRRARKGNRRSLRRYLDVVQTALPAVRVQAGDDAWGAIELTDGDHTLARLFPKGGLIKIDSLDAELSVAAFGPNLELNKSREWVLRLADSKDVASAVECTLHMSRFLGGRRVLVASVDRLTSSCPCSSPA